MGWKDLLTQENERVVLPWLGGRSVRSASRHWTIEGRAPREHGWYTFRPAGARTAFLEGLAEAQPDILTGVVRGYLVGDHLVPDDARVETDPKLLLSYAEKVFLLEPGLDRFARVAAGRMTKDGPLIYQGPDMPLGVEDTVLQAFLDQKTTVTDIKGVVPSLDVAFRMEVWQRAETERCRVELEKKRREEEELRQREERRKQLVETLGDAKGRRDLAKVDFAEAAKAALRVGDAEMLDHRKHVQKGEWVVKYRLDGRRFECVCDDNLRIVDAGICLIDHDTDERGDTFFTLESLPGVVREAMRIGRLVVFRHV